MSIFIVACQNTPEKEKIKQEIKSVNSHNSKNSLDWEGSYVASLDYPSCNGVITSISIDYDNSYKLVIENKGKTSIEIGNFKWLKGNGSISIKNTTYIVGENSLIIKSNNKNIDGIIFKKH